LVIHMLTSAESKRPRLEATSGNEEIPLEEGRPEFSVQFGQEREASIRHYLVKLLQEYRDVFAFGPEEMPSIDPKVMEHLLNIDPAH